MMLRRLGLSLRRMLPQHGLAAHDAAQDEARRCIARFIANPAGTDRAMPPREARGYSGTPGIGDALAAQRAGFAGDHTAAAEAFWRVAQAIPERGGAVSDHTRQLRIARALALMALARHAVKAGLAEQEWIGLGKADSIARQAVALQPLLLHLRREQAEILRALGRYSEALASLAEAMPLATGQTQRLSLAGTACDIAAQSRDAALMATAEERFVTPLFADGQGPAAPKDSDEQAWAWTTVFQAGKLALTHAEERDVENKDTGMLADRAARRFRRSLALMPAGSDKARAADRANIASWQYFALNLAAQAALARDLPLAAARRLDETRQDDARAAASLLRAWHRRNGARFACTAVLATEAGPELARVGFDRLAATSLPWRDAANTVWPEPPLPIRVTAPASILDSNATAQALINGTRFPFSIDRLRTRLKETYGFVLPSVQLFDDANPDGPARITVSLFGDDVDIETVPPDAELVLADTVEAEHAGLAPISDAPGFAGVAFCWVAQGTAKPDTPITVMPAAGAIVTVLERGVLGWMDRLIGLDDAARAFPSLTDAEMPQGLGVLRAALAERTPLTDALRAACAEHVKHGAPANGVIAWLRAQPGMRGQLWGNEPGRVAFSLPADIEAGLHACDSTAAMLLPDDLARALYDHAAAAASDTARHVLVVSDTAPRAQLRAFLRPAFPDLPVLSRSEHEERQR